MLGVMATVTTGLLSPNSYGLNTEQAVKMAATSDEYDDNPYDGARFTASQSSDSEPDTSATCYRLATPTETVPANNKRNKRKNFEPRCTNITFSDAENEDTLHLAINNNNNKNRRKTTARKIIHNPQQSNFYPMDLTKNESESQSDGSNSDDADEESPSRHFDSFHTQDNENEHENENNEDNEEENSNSGEDTDDKPANNFSIHNLSKSSTTPDFQQLAAAAAAASYHAQHALLNAAANGGVANGPGVDMREYAMNTMRELLGIYGLTSEVAESITRQLPIAAFTSGQMLESLSLHQLGNQQHTQPLQQQQQNASGSQTPPSQPPTPPSTPLSPKTPSASSISSVSHLSHLSNLASSLNNSVNNIPNIPSAIPNIPNVTITTSAGNTPSPLNLMSVKKESKNIISGGGGSSAGGSNRFLTGAVTPTNGNTSTPLGGGGGVGAHSSLSPQSAALNLSNLSSLSNLTALSQLPGLEYSYNQLEQLEALRNRTIMEENHKHLMNSRGIFPHLLNYSSMKSEDGSPPPSFDTTSPLNAIMAQTFNAQRDSQSLLTKSQTQIDYSKYVKKFSSSMECGSPYCKELNYREHFHCLDCNSRVFLKKEEMIRHFKWHKKRDESLQHGFMRYSPLDDCSDRYGNCCTHNKKQTHYHCIKEGCDKVYISTSDVQMHANYHRKDSAIIQEGFQRFRATEECGAAYCAFFGQRTTHFHCRRSNCRYTFKNKSDMEKHKTYHIKDEQLSRDGFKKFMKNEACPYESCRFSKVCNHIHCIRPQCNYVLHSSGQLFSHKRKHERKDSELAYRKYKLAQSMMKSLSDAGSTSFPSDFDAVNMNAFAMGMGSNTSESLSERNSPISYDEDNSAMDLTAGESNFDEASLNWATHSEEIWRKYCQLYSGNENCGCEYVNTEHYHCNGELCEMTFSSKEAAREHARQHDQQEQVTEMFFTLTCEDPTTCPYQAKDKHYHCTLEHCREVILPQDKTFRRLEHYKMHEYSKKLSLTKDPLTMTHLTTSIDGMFARKRGRPPKNRVIEVWNNDYQNTGQNIMDSPQAIFTSFKLPKPSSTSTPTMNNKEDDSDERSTSPKSPKSGFIDGVNLPVQGFDVFPENSKCPDMMCPYMGSMHYHCVQNRCMYVTDKEETLVTHSKDFHDNPDILEGYEFFEKGTDCRLASCQHKMERHFHCTRGDCNYTFVKYSTLSLHSLVHQPWDMQQQEQNLKQQFKNEAEDMVTTSNIVRDDRDKTQEKVSVVKASGTFYPLSSIAQPAPATVHERKSPDVSKSTDSNDISGSNTLYGPESSCSRPFCKLKRKFHYHCNACNQAFSEIDRLVVHVAKHSTGVLSGQTFHAEDNNNRNVTPSPPPTASKSPKIQVAPLQSLQNPTTPQIKEEPSNGGYLQQQFEAYQHFGNFPANLQFALMQQQQFLPQSYAAAAALSSQQLMFQHQAMMQNPLYGDNMSPLAAMAANLNKRALEGAQDMSPEAKKARIQSSMRILKDEPVPEGYLRFRFNEDCQYQHCGYREHQTHFHCQRMDCGYSFCDKTRFVQHTARHERLDTLMGGDFQQYRANVSCGRPDCAYTAHLGSTQNKASHFHCLKCDFVCTDTNKVVAHRRQHQKLDSIQAAGFEKFTPSQQCRSTTCQHSGKQTHYHCLQCQYAVLGLAQMSAHKYRHMEG